MRNKKLKKMLLVIILVITVSSFMLSLFGVWQNLDHSELVWQYIKFIVVSLLGSLIAWFYLGNDEFWVRLRQENQRLKAKIELQKTELDQAQKRTEDLKEINRLMELIMEMVERKSSREEIAPYIFQLDSLIHAMPEEIREDVRKLHDDFYQGLNREYGREN